MPDKEVAYLPFHLEDIPVNTLLCNVTQEVTFCGKYRFQQSTIIIMEILSII